MDKKVRKPERKEEKKSRQEKMEEERPLEKGAREEEQEKTKREMEEGQGGSQEKKPKVAEQAPSSYWDWLPPELKQDVEKKALYALIQERLDKGFRQIHDEMAELPRCRLHGTVSRCFLNYKAPPVRYHQVRPLLILFQILGDTVLCFEEEGHFQLELDWVDALFSVFE